MMRFLGSPSGFPPNEYFTPPAAKMYSFLLTTVDQSHTVAPSDNWHLLFFVKFTFLCSKV